VGHRRNPYPYDATMRLAKVAVLASVFACVLAGPAAAKVPDPDRNSDALTGWHW